MQPLIQLNTLYVKLPQKPFMAVYSECSKMQNDPTFFVFYKKIYSVKALQAALRAYY